MSKNLTKPEIIRSKQDIDRIFKEGKKFSTLGMRLIVVANNLNFDRFIIIPAKHYGRAVDRNKIRRQVKEIWRNYPQRLLASMQSQTTNGRDIAVIVYPGKVFDFSLLESTVTSLLDKIN
ncbi:MAG: ribonuclease P protein component [Spirochaetales bacterium]|nr:ribonuclease P protein component [Spirochaetales bacterium]